MKKNSQLTKIVLYQNLGFLGIIILCFLDDLLKLPSLIFSDHPFAFVYRRSTLEILLVLGVWFLVSNSTRRILERGSAIWKNSCGFARGAGGSTITTNGCGWRNSCSRDSTRPPRTASARNAWKNKKPPLSGPGNNEKTRRRLLRQNEPKLECRINKTVC